MLQLVLAFKPLLHSLQLRAEESQCVSLQRVYFVS